MHIPTWKQQQQQNTYNSRSIDSVCFFSFVREIKYSKEKNITRTSTKKAFLTNRRNKRNKNIEKYMCIFIWSKHHKIFLLGELQNIEWEIHKTIVVVVPLNLRK